MVFGSKYEHNESMIKLSIILSLLFTLTTNAQKKKREEYLNTGASFQAIQRMYDRYNLSKSHRPNELKYLEFNFYAYNELQKIIEPKEKARLFSFLQANYFRQLCKEGNARTARKNGGKVTKSDVNCSTYAIKVSEYSKYSPKYEEDPRSKEIPKVSIDFESNTYTIRNKSFSVITGNQVKAIIAHKKSLKKEKDSVEELAEPAVRQFLPKEQPAVESNH